MVKMFNMRRGGIDGGDNVCMKMEVVFDNSGDGDISNNVCSIMAITIKIMFLLQ